VGPDGNAVLVVWWGPTPWRLPQKPHKFHIHNIPKHFGLLRLVDRYPAPCIGACVPSWGASPCPGRAGARSPLACLLGASGGLWWPLRSPLPPPDSAPSPSRHPPQKIRQQFRYNPCANPKTDHQISVTKNVINFSIQV